MLKRINDALPGLVFGIVFYGIVVQLIGVWFVTDKISYSIGLWYGIAIAVGIAVNIATVIYDATIWTKGCQSQDRSKITFKVYCCCGPVIYIGAI
jgi:vacuolar-type H+-ATPase subunit I/STV1